MKLCFYFRAFIYLQVLKGIISTHFTHTDKPPPEATTGVPSKGDLVEPEHELVHIRTVRSSQSLPSDDNIHTVEQTDSDSNDSGDETVYHSVQQIDAQVHSLPTIDVPNL